MPHAHTQPASQPHTTHTTSHMPPPPIQMPSPLSQTHTPSRTYTHPATHTSCVPRPDTCLTAQPAQQRDSNGASVKTGAVRWGAEAEPSTSCLCPLHTLGGHMPLLDSPVLHLHRSCQGAEAAKRSMAQPSRGLNSRACNPPGHGSPAACAGAQRGGAKEVAWAPLPWFLYGTCSTGNHLPPALEELPGSECPTAQPGKVHSQGTGPRPGQAVEHSEPSGSCRGGTGEPRRWHRPPSPSSPAVHTVVGTARPQPWRSCRAPMTPLPG